MTSETKITCDGCGADLTTTDAMPAYTIKLSSEAREHVRDASGSYFVNAVIVRPWHWVREPRHFCGPQCLRSWLQEHE